MIKDFHDKNFDIEVIEASKTKPVLVDFSAKWCGPCKALTPVIENLAKNMASKAIVGKVGVDTAPNVTAKFRVMSLPTLIIFKDGNPQEMLVGLQQESVLTKLIEKYC